MDAATCICVSIAAHPGQFGLRFHNAGYRLFNLNFAYVPLRVRPDDTEYAIRLVRDNFHGCSLSMPHKVRGMALADARDETADRCGAANTLLREADGTLTAFNTDLLGTRRLLAARTVSVAGRPVLLLGAGGVARAIATALTDAGASLVIASRTFERAAALASAVGGEVRKWEDRNSASGFALVNATPVGMESDELPVTPECLERFEVVLDVIVRPESPLVRAARALGKDVVPGTVLAAYQAAEQFRIYTGRTLPETFVTDAADGRLP